MTITFNNNFTKAYVSATFMRKAHMYGTNEYKMLAAFRAENPTVLVEVHKNGSSPNTNLTYTNMELYIKEQPNSEELLKVFRRIKNEAMVQKNRHRYVCNWFRATFPNYKEGEQFQKREANEDTVIAMSAVAADVEKEPA